MLGCSVNLRKEENRFSFPLLFVIYHINSQTKPKDMINAMRLYFLGLSLRNF